MHLYARGARYAQAHQVSGMRPALSAAMLAFTDVIAYAGCSQAALPILVSDIGCTLHGNYVCILLRQKLYTCSSRPVEHNVASLLAPAH